MESLAEPGVCGAEGGCVADPSVSVEPIRAWLWSRACLCSRAERGCGAERVCVAEPSVSVEPNVAV